MGRDIHFATLYDNRRGNVPGNNEWDFICITPNINDPFTSDVDWKNDDGVMSAPFVPAYFRNRFFFDMFVSYLENNKDVNLNRLLKMMIDNSDKEDWTKFSKSSKVKMTMGTDIEMLQYIFDKEDFGAFNQEILTLKTLKHFKKDLEEELFRLGDTDDIEEYETCIKITKRLIDYFKCVKMITQANVGDNVKVKDEDIIILIAFDN